MKSRMRENLKSGSVRGIENFIMVKYCGTPQIERVEQRRIQSRPKDEILRYLLDKIITAGAVLVGIYATLNR